MSTSDQLFRAPAVRVAWARFDGGLTPPTVDPGLGATPHPSGT